MEKIEILGIIAAILTTSAFVPQVYKVWTEKSTKDISLSMYLIFLLGLILWLIYGMYQNSLSIILANAVTGILAIILIILKLKYK